MTSLRSGGDMPRQDEAAFRGRFLLSAWSVADLHTIPGWAIEAAVHGDSLPSNPARAATAVGAGAPPHVGCVGTACRGASPRVVQERLAHASIAVTRDRCSHVQP